MKTVLPIALATSIVRVPASHCADLSHYDGKVDFGAMQTEGGALAVIWKCTQGDTYRDPTYLPAQTRARATGLKWGGYLYLNVSTPPAPQVENFLAAAHLTAGDIQPIIDAEAPGLTCDAVFAALDDLAGRGYRPIVYSSLSFWNDVLHADTQYPLWLAAYREVLPDLPLSVDLFGWQHTDKGIFPGVSVPCDVSYLYGNLSEYLI